MGYKSGDILFSKIRLEILLSFIGFCFFGKKNNEIFNAKFFKIKAKLCYSINSVFLYLLKVCDHARPQNKMLRGCAHMGDLQGSLGPIVF